MKHIGKTFIQKTIDIDVGEYESCTFIRCKLRYGGESVAVPKCIFNQCRWEFTGAAITTLRFLAVLAEHQTNPEAFIMSIMGEALISNRDMVAKRKGNTRETPDS